MIAMKSISETLDVYNIGMVTEAANGQILDNSTQPEILLYLNGTFQVIESGLSHVGILHIGGIEGVQCSQLCLIKIRHFGAKFGQNRPLLEPNFAHFFAQISAKIKYFLTPSTLFIAFLFDNLTKISKFDNLF